MLEVTAFPLAVEILLESWQSEVFVVLALGNGPLQLIAQECWKDEACKEGGRGGVSFILPIRAVKEIAECRGAFCCEG